MIQTIRWCFYPRSPCGERPGLPLAQSAAKWFLSTLSLRRATPDAAKLCGIQPFLSTLSLRRATVTVLGIQHRVGVSIHALLAESDCPFLSLCRPFLLFLSTLSLRRATGQNLVNGIRLVVSIHALLAESDKIDKILNLAARRFYPRSPCGERHPEKSESLTTYLVSIHALLAESDSGGNANNWTGNAFLSTLSLRRATCGFVTRTAGTYRFYPRSPCGERLARAWTQP